jgi:hypothetical protein
MKMIQYATGGKQVPKKRKYREIDHRLTELKQRLHNLNKYGSKHNFIYFIQNIILTLSTTVYINKT